MASETKNWQVFQITDGTPNQYRYVVIDNCGGDLIEPPAPQSDVSVTLSYDEQGNVSTRLQCGDFEKFAAELQRTITEAAKCPASRPAPDRLPCIEGEPVMQGSRQYRRCATHDDLLLRCESLGRGPAPQTDSQPRCSHCDEKIYLADGQSLWMHVRTMLIACDKTTEATPAAAPAPLTVEAERENAARLCEDLVTFTANHSTAGCAWCEALEKAASEIRSGKRAFGSDREKENG